MKNPITYSEARAKNAIIVNHFRKEADAESCRKAIWENIRWKTGPKPRIYYFKDDIFYKVVVRSKTGLSDYGMDNLQRAIMKALANSFKS